jgi:hypothetical protein
MIKGIDVVEDDPVKITTGGTHTSLYEDDDTDNDITLPAQPPYKGGGLVAVGRTRFVRDDHVVHKELGRGQVISTFQISTGKPPEYLCRFDKSDRLVTEDTLEAWKEEKKGDNP